MDLTSPERIPQRMGQRRSRLNLRRLTSHHVAAVLMVVLGIAGILQSLELGYMLRGVPGPGFFPFWSSVLLTVSAVGWLIKAGVTGAQDRELDAQTLGIRAAGVAGYIVGIWLLGFIVASIIYLTYILRWRAGVSWWAVLLVNALVIATMEVVFRGWLNMPLPRGPLGV